MSGALQLICHASLLLCLQVHTVSVSVSTEGVMFQTPRLLDHMDPASLTPAASLRVVLHSDKVANPVIKYADEKKQK